MRATTLRGVLSILIFVAALIVPAIAASPASAASTLGPDQTLTSGTSLSSPNGHVLKMQTDGNLVVIAPGNVALWSTETHAPENRGAIARMQADGNLVVIAPGNRAVWESGTACRGLSTLRIQDDGNAVIYGPFGATWSWRTKVIPGPCASPPAPPPPAPAPPPPPPAQPPAPGAGPTSPATRRGVVMTWNIKGKENSYRKYLAKWVRVIERHRPDIVGLQETCDDNTAGVIKRRLERMYELKYYSRSGRAGSQASRNPYCAKQFGSLAATYASNTILSRKPIKDAKTTSLGTVCREAHPYGGCAEADGGIGRGVGGATRNMLAVTTTIAGRTVRVINAHVGNGIQVSDDERVVTQKRQIDMIVESASRHPHAIVLGDFNVVSEPDESPPPALSSLTEKGFFEVDAKRNAATYPGKVPKKIDYIFLKGLERSTAKVDDSIENASASDHYPLIADVRDPAPTCTRANSVAAIIDDSASMGGTDPQKLRRRAMELLIAKPGGEGRTLGAIEFGSEAVPLFAPTTVAGAQNQMLGALAAIDGDRGGTDYDAAFQASTLQQPGAQARIFLTDGGHNGDYFESHRGGPRTFVIGVGIERGGDEDADRLARIAAETGGRYFPLQQTAGDDFATQALRLQPVFNTVDALLDCKAPPQVATRRLTRLRRFARAVIGRFRGRRTIEVVVSWGTSRTDLDVAAITARSRTDRVVADLGGPTKRHPKRRKLVVKAIEGETFDVLTIRRPPRASHVTLRVRATRLSGPTTATIQVGPAG